MLAFMDQFQGKEIKPFIDRECKVCLYVNASFTIFVQKGEQISCGQANAIQKRCVWTGILLKQQQQKKRLRLKTKTKTCGPGTLDWFFLSPTD